MGWDTEDLCGFRCGVLHTLSEETKHIRDEKSRIVLHVGGAHEDDSGLRHDELPERAVHRVSPGSKVGFGPIASW